MFMVNNLMFILLFQIRQECLQVLNKILTSTSTEKIDPFYDIMSTYLRSAMTNIDYRLQEDSLLFLDILLVCTPQKVAEDFHKIIPNFLSMISKLRVDSKPGRTLTVNLGSQMTSVKWRVKVLHRLQDYLKKFVQNEQIIDDDDRVVIENTIMYNRKKRIYYPLFNPNYTAVCHLSCFSSKAQENETVDEVNRFIEYIDTLMPLLFETWLEVCPNESSERSFETVISEDAASSLKHTLEVITLLWGLVKYFNKKSPSSNIENIFCQKYRKQYTQHFVKTFPYVTNIKKKQKNESTPFENVITDPKLIEENLEICHLFILLNPKINVKSNNHEIVSVLNYIEKNFNENSPDNVNNAIIKILRTIFSNEINGWTKTLNVMDSLFRKIIWTYFNKTMSSTFKQKIFGLLCRIALNDNLSHFHKTDAFDKWCTNLPDILLDASINVQTINIIQKYASHYNKKFNHGIKPKLFKVIDNLRTITITDAVDNTSYYKLFSLLYWINGWDNSSLDLLEKQLLDLAYSPDHTKYIVDTIKLKSMNTL